jgi:hypothetical protein
MQVAFELPREAVIDLDDARPPVAQLRREARLPEVRGLEEVVVHRDDVRLHGIPPNTRRYGRAGRRLAGEPARAPA